MEILNVLSKKYKFSYGIVNEFNVSNLSGFDKISKYGVLNVNPKLVLNDCRSVIVFAFGYDRYMYENDGAICSYAMHDDYHKSILPILTEISTYFEDSVIQIDSNLLNERYFAFKSGLGFIGKNSMLITKEFGSYCHLALLLVKEKLESTTSITVNCGKCNLCIKNCPTNAFENNFEVTKCICELTQDKSFMGDFSLFGNHVYGCDDCITICPFNKEVKQINAFSGIDLKTSLTISKHEFDKYKQTGFYWIGYRTFLRNVHIAYINKYDDYSKVNKLNLTNSKYLHQVYNKLMEENNEL